MGSENVLEHIWQYLNHRGLSKSCKALKKEASLSGKVDAVMLGTVLSRLETPKVETTLEPKEIESAQESSEIIKEKVDKKSKKSKSDSKKSKTESKKSKTVETSVVDEDTATLVSGLTEIINSDAIEQQSQFNDDDESNGKITKKRKIEQVEQVEEPSRSEKAINVTYFLTIE